MGIVHNHKPNKSQIRHGEFKMSDTKIIVLPHPGFYHSWLSNEIDNQVEQWAEYEADYRQDENEISKELQLDQDEFHNIACDCMDYSNSYLETNKAYVDAFIQCLDDEIDLNLNLRFESMVSPKEYNFATDTVYCEIEFSDVQKLFEIAKEDNFSTLGNLIKERHSHRSGFISSYSNDLQEWLSMPLDEWDHNHLETLLMAVIEFKKGSYGFDDALCMEVLTNNDGLYHAFDAGMDWAELNRRIADKRAEIMENLRI